MHKSNKKGSVSATLWITLGVIAALLLIIVFVFFADVFKALWFSLIGVKKDIECANDKDWNQIKEALKKLESDETYSEVFFYNEGCNLASFTATQQMQNYEVKPTKLLTENPEICLCKVDSDLCKPYDCYKLSKFSAVVGPKGSQFTTFNFGPNVLLRFFKDGKTLRIDTPAKEKSPEPIYYKYEEKYSSLDKTHLIDEMQIIFKTNQIQGYLPVVTLKQEIPFEIPKKEGITTAFDLSLMIKPPEKADIKEINQQYIDLNLVQSALVSFPISKEKFESLPESERKLSLYYNLDGIWKSIPLMCEKVERTYFCGTLITQFAKEYVISIRQKTVTPTSDLTQFIDQVSIANGIEPKLIKSIIQAESAWNANAVSMCGAAGLVQFIPSTARSFGLSVPEYEKEWCPDEATTKCKLNGNQVKVSACNSCTKNKCDLINDERFNPQKAVEASVKYLAKIKQTLISKGMEPSISYIAAAYNQGEGRVTDCKCIPPGEATTYVANVLSNYKQLSVQETAVALK